MIKGKVFFITGGAGFIASWLIERLYRENEIIVYDNLHRNSLSAMGLDSHPNVKIIQGDVLDGDHLRKSIPDSPDYIFHLAAIAGVGMVVSHPNRTLKVNLLGTYNLLEAIKDKSPLRVVDFSTSEVYGPHVFRADEGGMTTQGPIGEPRWVYAMSKLASEHLSYSYHVEFGLPCVTIRPFNVYGPGQIGEGAIHHFVTRAIRGEDIVVHGDGAQVRSWCYVTDMIDALIALCDCDDAVGHVFNIGNPQATGTVLELANKIKRLAKSDSKIVFRHIDYPDVEVRVPSIEKARRILGWEPRVGYDDGIIKTIEWYAKEVKIGLNQQE